MEKELEKLNAELKNLQEIVSSKFTASKSDEEKEAELRKLADKVKELNQPKVRAMQWVTDEKNKSENGIYLGTFLKAIHPSRNMKVSEDVKNHIIKSTMTEGDDSLGGYGVPEEYSNQIIMLENQDSIIRRLARLFPMGTDTRNLPKQLTNVSVSWVGEGTAISETNPTLGRIVQTAKKVAAIVKLTDELLADNKVGMDKFIMELVAEAIATEEDRVALVGNTGGGDPFDGLLYATGVNSVTMAGTSVAYDDVIDLIHSVNAKYRAGASIVTSTDGLKLLLKLKDGADQYIYSSPKEGIPATLCGYPIEISDTIPSNLGGGTDETAIFFGNFKKHLFISDRGGYVVDSSNSASDISNSQSAYLEDEIWYRFKKRMAITVANAGAFAKMQVK